MLGLFLQRMHFAFLLLLVLLEFLVFLEQGKFKLRLLLVQTLLPVVSGLSELRTQKLVFCFQIFLLLLQLAKPLV